MPAASESVPNRALSTSELRTLLERDFTRMLDNHSLLSSPAAFGRVSYHLSLMITNEISQQSTDISLDSKPIAKNVVSTSPALAAVTAHPMPSQTELTKTLTQELSRMVTSPNAERLREGLPVPVEVKQNDGTTALQTIAYEPDKSMPEDVSLKEW